MTTTLDVFINDMTQDLSLVEDYFNDPQAVAKRYGLTDAEYDAVISRDISGLSKIGLNPEIAEIALYGRHKTLAFVPVEGYATSV